MPLYLGNTPIGGVKTSILGDSVLYTEQNLTEEQKAQARENIGAISEVQVDTSISETSTNPVQNKAIKSYVDAAVAGVVESAPETLNTLNELAAALGDDPNFATTMATQIGNKVDKIDGKSLSTNDYTTAEKEKLAGITIVTTTQDGLMSAADKVKLDSIAAGATGGVQADLFENDTSSDAYVKNRIFGYYNKIYTNVFPLTTLSKDDAGSSWSGQYNLGFNMSDRGVTFVITFDGIEYIYKIPNSLSFDITIGGFSKNYPFELQYQGFNDIYVIFVNDITVDHTLKIDRLEQTPVKLTSDWIESAIPNTHASTHGTNGADPITPNMIGAASTANAEAWVFTLEDGSTVTKEVILK